MDKPNFQEVIEHLLVEQINKRAERDAKAKLERIIERNGDANGARREPQYLEQLYKEALCEQLLTTLLRPIQIIKEEEECVLSVAKFPAMAGARTPQNLEVTTFVNIVENG